MSPSWSQRLMMARSAGVLLRPPSGYRGVVAWHILNRGPGAGQVRAEWRPGTERWVGESGENWTAEGLGELGWTYVGPSLEQDPS